jgi:hypothetical protein
MKHPAAISFVVGTHIPVITDPDNTPIGPGAPLIPRRLIPPMAGGAPPALPGRGRPQQAILLPQDIAAINGVRHPGVRLH